jgi:SAM-dependent methyltransferase
LKRNPFNRYAKHDISMHEIRSSASLVGKKVLSRCRICGSGRITKRGEVEFYFGWAWPIYDCDDCGCRFTLHDNSVYDLLHSEQNSCYGRYTAQAQTCKMLFNRGDLAGLRTVLSEGTKYRFIISEIDRASTRIRILEIGSARGHLTSYFILSGRDITGVDISPEAVKSAKADFGDHFVQAGDPTIEARAPYDVIFHVGTIGCVADPVGMTRQWLGLLKPGGKLLFNAPNRDACTLRDQLWFESAPPPDVVTLFSPGFWRDGFSEVAQTDEKVEFRPSGQNSLILLRRVARRKWRRPVPIHLRDSECWPKSVPSIGDGFWRNLERVVGKVGLWTRLDRLVPPYASEFGLFVQMTKRCRLGSAGAPAHRREAPIRSRLVRVGGARTTLTQIGAGTVN